MAERFLGAEMYQPVLENVFDGLGIKLEKFMPNARYFENQFKVEKPWGSYSDILRDKAYVLKTIAINPGQSLSLQRHFNRSEFWLVIEGEGNVQLGKLTHYIKEGQTVHIHRKEVHRATNTGSVPLVILELQYGPDCSEEDIERLEDNYGRG